VIARRDVLRLGLYAAGGALVGSSPWLASLARATAETGPGPFGPLLDPDENGIQLPRGFRSRVLARAQQVVPGTDYTWHIFPDGGATFPVFSGWIYVSNSEIPGTGGAGALRFDRAGRVVDAYPILTGTIQNCAGGKTPWQTWLSCEEYPGGYVWECDPRGRGVATPHPAMGRFQHEAVAADPVARHFYLTEDVGDGGLYRFRPARWGDLSAGVLEIASVDDRRRVEWIVVPDPDPVLQDGATPTRLQVPEATPFDGGEGIVVHERQVYVTTKGDNRVWRYDTRLSKIDVVYEASLDPGRQLTGVDNIEVGPGGDLLVAEDGGNMELVVITPDEVAYPLLRVVGQDGSELAGPAFSPDGRRLYLSSQRGEGVGITYEIEGPFPRRRGGRRRLARRLRA
jgi:secreted PhoX family phosphatase